MTTVADILKFVETLAPRAMKMDWDNVGLLCGSKLIPVTKVLVALDPFEHVCEEAAQWGAELIVTHHPMIFRPLSSVTDETSIGRGIMTLCRHGISAVNAHTNLDQAPGGVNDELARKLALVNVQVLNPAGITESGESWGLLRAGEVPEQPLDAFLNRVKTLLGCEGLRYVNGGKPVRKVCVGGGSCADGMLEAVDAGCDTFVTADVKYNQFWDAHDLGLNLIDAGHFYTENPVVDLLAKKLAAAFPEVEVKISEAHRDCMKFY
ncbi:MAG: Nif3-like dinuclear metal center hexameric protein [Oscillospiraceae bacterium]|nr:Nif3-like dinuclear metal center hexameric protein [Oscillospiraceae bacterium]